jgi:hypothetical protein
MSHVKIHEHHQTMTRLEVAVELRRLATQLEWEKCITYGDGTIAAPCKIERVLEIDESVEGGAFTMNFKLNWVAHDGESSPRTATHSDRRHRSTNEVGREQPVAHDLTTANEGTPVGSRRRGMRNHQSFELSPATSPNRLHNKALTPHP